MSHEQSETATTDNGAINLYGRNTAINAGQPLPPIFRFEQSQYPNLDSAVQASIMRSILDAAPGRAPQGGPSDILRSNPQIGNQSLMQALQQAILQSYSHQMQSPRCPMCGK